MPNMSKRKKSRKDFKKGTSTKDVQNNKPWGYNKNSDSNNDVAWYTKYPELVKAQSSIIFNSRYGANLSPSDQNYSNPPFGAGSNTNSIPGVIGFNFRPVLAETGADNDALNICSKNLYTYIRHANSGSANYESSDLMQYVISVLGIAILLEQAKRDLRLVMTFNPLNRYVYQKLLRARGYSQAAIDDMVTNNAVYVGNVNALIAQLNTFKVPKDFSIFDKFSWMVTNVFKDDNLNKASYYFYQTHDVIHYDWANRTVESTEVTLTTFPAYLQSIQSEINNLLAYEDVGIMLGDILKAYKAEGCRIWSSMDVGEVQDSTYSGEVLLQFNNSVCLPVTGKLSVKQLNANSQLLALYQGSSTTAGQLTASVVSVTVPDSNALFASDTAFNPELICFDDQPSNETVIIATRNMFGFKFHSYADGPTYKTDAVISKYPTHIITDIMIGNYDKTGTYTMTSTKSVLFYTDSESVHENNVIHLAYFLSHFPTLYRYFVDSSRDIHTFVYGYGKNNLIVTESWLGKLHDGCKMSELSLPMFKLLESN